MKISHEWLKEFVPHTLTAEAVGDLMSRHAVTLDGIAQLRADLASFVVARVIETEKIPDTKLSFNKVDDGSGELLEVVCGAPNVVAGTLYPFARTGTVMPAGITIERRKIRGFTSNGMLCSARELGMGTDHEGILALDLDVAPGTPLLQAMPLGGEVLDLDVLPNRPDLLSHLGIARELAALLGVPAQTPDELREAAPGVPPTRGATIAEAGGAKVTVEDAAGCPRYVAALIRGVVVGPSPAWLVSRVESMGGRSINNVVDATNYILFGLGQPVHAFDFAKLKGGAIVVRKARDGEKLVTLDGVERTLQPWMTIIADGAHATALAGVMGGKGSEVTATTTDVLVEVATFAPRDVRKVRRALGLSTDASYRFERGVDSGRTDWCAAHAAALIVLVAGGTVEAMLEVGAPPAPRAPVALRVERVTRLLGTAVPANEISRLLTSIGFEVKASSAGDSFNVVAPSWRHDIGRDVDLIEEIARLRGYDALPDDLRPYRAGTVPDHPMYLTSRRIREALVAAGFAEARPMPFTAGDGADSAGFARVANPLADDEPFLRRSLLDTLARRAEYNLSRSIGNVRLFEIGSVFEQQGPGLPIESVRAAAIMMGERRPPHFTDPKPPAFDAWDAKSVAGTIARATWPGLAVELEADEQSIWKVVVAGGVVGFVRAIKLDAPVWASPAFGVELALGLMPSVATAAQAGHSYGEGATAAERQFPHVQALPVTPAAEFDLALLVPDGVSAATVEAAMTKAAGPMLEQLALFDEFRGNGVPAGTRSLAWRLTFRHPERTLRNKEIDGRRSQLLKTLESELGVVPRTA